MSTVVVIDPEIHSGDPCFAGTRVPVDILFAYLAANDSVETFLEQYPSVTRDQVETLLREVTELAKASAQKVPA